MRITEIFHSIQGESSYAGLPCVFVRLTWCNLRCTWCDSEYTFSGGAEMELDEIIDRVLGYGCNLVEITGGEPLVQKKPVCELITRLCDLGYKVLVETGGGLDAEPIDARAVRIIDVKCPGSGESERNYWTNLEHLRPHDEIKFVIGDRRDFDYALDVIRRYELDARGPESLFSPVWGAVDLREFAAWIIESGIRARMQLQLHKYIWGPEATGV